MYDLISRQAAIDEAYSVIVDDAVYDVVQVETLESLPTIDEWTIVKEYCHKRNLVIIAKEMLEALPSVDAVKVVRCKDCKHSKRWYSDKCICFLFSKTGNSVFEDGYCCYGERKICTT